jgi:hypothetical protein
MVDETTDHQAGSDGKWYLGDENYQSKSTITGVLCK